MANITTATNGTYQPVSNMDSGTVASSPGAGFPTPLNSATSAVTVNLAGPKLDFFTITLANLATSGTVLNATMLAIQTKATIGSAAAVIAPFTTWFSRITTRNKGV